MAGTSFHEVYGVFRYLATSFIGTRWSTKRIPLMAELWWDLKTVNLSLSIISILFFPGFSYQFLGGPEFWPSGMRTLHDFLGHILLSKLYVFGCTWPKLHALYQLQGVVTHGHGTPLAGVFHKAFGISWIQNRLKSVALFRIHPSGTYWCIWCIKHKNALIYIYIYDMRYVSSPRHLLTTRNALQKRNSAKSGAELGGCIKPYEILAWQWLWGNVGQHWAGAANQVKLELSRTVIQYCKNYAKTMMIYLRRGRSNNDVSKLFATFFLRSGLGNMCPHGRMRFPSSYQAITQWCFFHPKSSWSGQQRSCRSQLEYFSTAWISHGFPEGSSTKLPFWVAVLLNGDVGSNLSK